MIIFRKIHKVQISLFITIITLSCTKEPIEPRPANSTLNRYAISLNQEQADDLARLPLKCINTRLPYKPGYTITGPQDLKMPDELHPAFYGCFDWHSAVHGHWSLVYLLKNFPNLEVARQAREKLNFNLKKEHIEKELAYFKLNKYTKNFERTYGWAWLLKLQEELYNWDDPDGQIWLENIQPLADYFSASYLEYLPKLVYPIRVGEHTNTAFGLSFAYDYALTVNNKELSASIKEHALRFFKNDTSCPIDWEPSGYDFISPCLQELALMKKVLPPAEFIKWSATFLPELVNGNLHLAPGEIKDRSDGKMVHLDGLNFSRAWCLYQLSNNEPALLLADKHLDHSLGNIADGDYAGEHWLASFALYALKVRRAHVSD